MEHHIFGSREQLYITDSYVKLLGGGRRDHSAWLLGEPNKTALVDNLARLCALGVARSAWLGVAILADIGLEKNLLKCLRYV